MLQTVPALRALRSSGSLAFSGQPRLGKLLCGLGLVDEALPFDGLGLEALFTPGAPSPSLVARLTRFDRLVSWFGARDDTYGQQLRSLSPDCVIALPQPSEGSAQTVWRHLLATVDVNAAADVAPAHVPAAWRDEGQRALDELGAEPARPLLFVHPGAGARWKLWPVEHHARVLDEVVRHTGAQALIHQGPADREIAEALVRILDMDVLHLVEPDLPQLAGILACASAYLGVDSGVSHLAAAVGARAVVLYPAVTRERWESWSPTALCVTMNTSASQADAVAAALIERIEKAAGAG